MVTVVISDDEPSTFPVYLDASGMEMMWSGDFPIPPIGSRVFVLMNGIGWAIVKGYFESYGYVGLMTLPTKPPKWLREQQRRERNDPMTPRWSKEGIGCEFGNELSLKRPKKASSQGKAGA